MTEAVMNRTVSFREWVAALEADELVPGEAKRSY